MFSLIKRDIWMRLYYGKYAILTQLIFFLCMTLFFIIGYSIQGLGNQTNWLSFERIWDGFSLIDLALFKEGGSFNIPYVWLIFQLLFLLSLRTFFINDLTNSSGVIIIRVGIKRFIISKILSLLVYIVIYTALLYLFIILVSFIQYWLFDTNIAIFSQWKISVLFYIFLVLALFIQAITFEVTTIFLGEITSFILLFIIIVISIFSENRFLITNYTMFSRWEGTALLKDHLVLISIWLVLIMTILLVIKIIVVKKIDLINEKGER